MEDVHTAKTHFRPHCQDPLFAPSVHIVARTLPGPTLTGPPSFFFLQVYTAGLSGILGFSGSSCQDSLLLSLCLSGLCCQDLIPSSPRPWFTLFNHSLSKHSAVTHSALSGLYC